MEDKEIRKKFRKMMGVIEKYLKYLEEGYKNPPEDMEKMAMVEYEFDRALKNTIRKILKYIKERNQEAKIPEFEIGKVDEEVFTLFVSYIATGLDILEDKPIGFYLNGKLMIIKPEKYETEIDPIEFVEKQYYIIRENIDNFDNILYVVEKEYEPVIIKEVINKNIEDFQKRKQERIRDKSL